MLHLAQSPPAKSRHSARKWLRQRDGADSALRIHLRARAQKFQACVGELRASGQGFLVPEDRGVHGVGHSNGALLHLLIGATAAPPNISNVLLSFNNKCARAPHAPLRAHAELHWQHSARRNRAVPALLQAGFQASAHAAKPAWQ